MANKIGPIRTWFILYWDTQTVLGLAMGVALALLTHHFMPVLNCALAGIAGPVLLYLAWASKGGAA